MTLGVLSNLAYVVIFLRNANERERAVILTKDALGIDIADAITWVDSVQLIKSPKDNDGQINMQREYPYADMKTESELMREFEIVISHSPKGFTPT